MCQPWICLLCDLTALQPSALRAPTFAASMASMRARHISAAGARLRRTGRPTRAQLQDLVERGRHLQVDLPESKGVQAALEAYVEWEVGAWGGVACAARFTLICKGSTGGPCKRVHV